jgi:hypothetical protein
MTNNSFKKFYETSKGPEYLFEKVFNKFYTRGHWGKIDRDMIRNQQWDWFNKLSIMIESKDLEGLIQSLSHRDCKVSRDMFEKLTNISLHKMKSKLVEKELTKFCK